MIKRLNKTNNQLKLKNILNNKYSKINPIKRLYKNLKKLIKRSQNLLLKYQRKII